VTYLDACVVVWSFGVEDREISSVAVQQIFQNQSWTRDPFDRLIVANALANDAPLITKDEEIRRNYSRSIW
jgi:PIN domain nuclease of toxin-antitoxin system